MFRAFCEWAWRTSCAATIKAIRHWHALTLRVGSIRRIPTAIATITTMLHAIPFWTIAAVLCWQESRQSREQGLGARTLVSKRCPAKGVMQFGHWVECCGDDLAGRR